MKTKLKKIARISLIAFLVWYTFALPKHLFNTTYSTVILDKTGSLLGAHIAMDEQWRFPKPDSLPEDYINALLTYEDQQFYQHPGVNPFSLFQALIENIQSGRIKRGGSTITMQVIRMSRGNPARTIPEKLYEIILATRLELSLTKEEILLEYAAHAPYGGNVVGIEAACWRYFGRSLHQLSKAEYAMLAVLPNNPALIHLGRNRKALQTKRNLLLYDLWLHGILDENEKDLAQAEELPSKPIYMPRSAVHLSALLNQTKRGRKTQTTIDPVIQKNLMFIIKNHQRKLIANHIYNASVLIAEVETGNVVAYAGNGPSTPQNQAPYVNMVSAPRSTGSVIKPFLFNSMLNSGELLPDMLVPDIPVFFNGFHPKNYNKTYDGAVPASLALTRSLNVPAVLMLKDYGIENFRLDLKKWGFTSINRSSSFYGLSLILGGAEVTLWELTSNYRKLALLAKQKEKALPMHFMGNKEKEPLPAFHSGGAYLTLKTIRDLTRPSNEIGWKTFSSKSIAWKTGTSFGHRDAWAVGVSNNFVVGVWIGNASGEGRASLTGIDAAAPVLFDVFSSLDKGTWLEMPYESLEKITLCKLSGYPASMNCEETFEGDKLSGIENYGACPYHQKVFLDEFAQYRVHADCYPQDKMVSENIFILPPSQESYYRKKHLEYKGLPPWDANCNTTGKNSVLQLIYPADFQILVPTKDLSGSKGKIVFKAAHGNPNEIVYWHIDESYIGQTQYFHDFAIELKAGQHTVYLIDGNGNETLQNFEVKFN